MKAWQALKLLAVVLFVALLAVRFSRKSQPPILQQSSPPTEAPIPEVVPLPSFGPFPALGTPAVAALGGRVWLGLLNPAGEKSDSVALNHLRSKLRRHPARDSLKLIHFDGGPEFSDDLEMLLDPGKDGIKELRQELETGLGGEPVPQAAGVLVDERGEMRGIFDLTRAQGREQALFALDRVLLEKPEHLCILEEAEQPGWLSKRANQQKEKWATENVFHDFEFEDNSWESGIRFVHRCNDNAGRRYQAVHYDHGNGVAAADVDGDGLQDLLFTNQVGRNGLWRNKGEGKFVDITAESGLGVPHRTCVSASFADFDNDGDPDVYITTIRDGNLLFVNQGEGRFRKVSDEFGVAFKGHSSGSVWFDYDGDGWLDLFVSNIGQYTTTEKRVVSDDATTESAGQQEVFESYEGLADAFTGHLQSERSESSKLYRNLSGGSFEDVTKRVGLVDESWSGDAIIMDGNVDGWPDLYLLNMQGDDQYYENQNGESFLNKSQQLFNSTPWGSMGAALLDFDRNQTLDLFITDMHSDMSRSVEPTDENKKSDMKWKPKFLANPRPSIFGNALFSKGTSGHFSEISDQIGLENYWPWGPTAADFNADGFTDLFVASSMNYNFRYALNSLFLNVRGEYFSPAELVLGVEPRLGGRTIAPWFEFNTAKEKEVAKSPHFKDLEGEFLVWGALGSRAGVAFDLDEDGDLDLVTAEFNSAPQVLVSNLSEKQLELHYLRIDLVGTKSNRDGIGASVTVTSESGRQIQYHNGKTGYLSQSSLPLYFGLGDDSSIDSVEVLWPSGVRQRIAGDLRINTTLKVVESKD